ncbi:MAG: hypothetical protein COA86_16535 [Kangiella sp.]|nr:MAG: hypothetical protein COA86_16535 [Kangiella sp.]
MQIADRIVLDQRSTYILPTKAGFLLILIILLMMIASTNYQNNLAFLLTFLICSIGIVSIVFTFKNLQGLAFELGKNQSVFAGEQLNFNFHVSSQSGSPHLGIAVGFDKKSLFYLDLLSSEGKLYNKKTFILSVKVEKRGWYSAPKIVTTSCFPFGLLKVWSWFKFKSPVLIYPQPIEPEESVINRIANDDGDSNNRTANEETEYDGITAYKIGDPISRVDWKATAKEQGMYIKSFTSMTVNESAFSWDDFSNVEYELRLSYLCYLVLNANDQKKMFSLSLPGLFVSKDSGENHLIKCLANLALFKLDELL